MRYHFIVNPVAGRGTMVPVLDEVESMLRADGAEVSRYTTTGAGDAGRHIGELGADDADRVVLVGGDGTLREAVNGRPPVLPWPVGLIPAGTANLVARELNMPRGGTPREITEALRTAKPWTVDLLAMERAGAPTEYAVANIGVGLDAKIVHAIDENREASSGSGGYTKWIRPIWEAFQSFRFPKMAVTVDGARTFRASSVVIQNAYNYGGLFHLSPKARLDSASCDVMLLRCRARRDLFRVMFGAFRKKAGGYKDVRFERGTTINLSADRSSPVQADGDPAGFTDLSIRLVPASLTLLRAAGPAPTNGDTA